MPELTKNKATISPQKQLHWFVNKLISIYENPITIILQEYDELTCFPVDLLRKEGTGLFPLGRNAGATEYDNEDQEYASYCTEMLEKIKRDIPKLEEYSLHFNKEDFVWYEDNNNFEGNGYAFYLDCDYKPIFEAYLRFMNGDKKVLKIISLKNKKVEFDEVTSTIIVNGKKCPLPAAKNEEYLARAMFSREVGESIDWSIIYKEMSGSEATIGSAKNKKTLVDTVNRLNNRIKEIIGTEDKLISCNNKNVKRNY